MYGFEIEVFEGVVIPNSSLEYWDDISKGFVFGKFNNNL